jgi:hypothetical protein
MEKRSQSTTLANTGSVLSMMMTGMQPCRIASSALVENPSPAVPKAEKRCVKILIFFKFLDS